MPKHRRYSKNTSLPWIETKILSIEEIRHYDGEQTKISFLAESKTGKQRLCVYWNNKDLNIGDELQIKGFFKNEVFIVKELMRLKKGVADGCF